MNVEEQSSGRRAYVDYDDDVAIIDFRRMASIVLERLWLVSICFISAVLVGLGYLTITPKQYQSTAVVEVAQQNQRVIAMEEIDAQDFRSLEVLKTIESNLKRHSLFQQVMEREDIKNKRQLFPDVKNPADKPEGDELGRALADWTTVGLVRGTRLISVSVEHQVPELAQLLANSIVHEFMRERIEMRSGSGQAAFKFLMDEAERVREKLQKSEDALQDFTDAIEIKEKIEEQEDIVAELLQRYRDKHPKLIQARSLLMNLKNQFRTELLNIRNRMGESGDLWAGQRMNPKELDRTERIETELKLLEARFNVLSREVETDRTLYESIVERMGQTDVAKQLDTIPVEIAEEANLPHIHSKPRKKMVLLLAAFGGGALGVGLAFGLFLLDTSLRTVDDAEKIIGLPVVGALPDENRLPDVVWMRQSTDRMLHDLKNKNNEGNLDLKPQTKKKAKSKGKIEPLVLLSDPGGRTAEGFRSLRASLKMLGPLAERKTFLITSAIPGEGKSFVSGNVAVAFAQEGAKTLLIDADLRRPMIDKIFDLKKIQKGFVEALVEGGNYKSFVMASGIDNLDLLPIHTNAPNPAELLSGEALGKLMASLVEDYDRIVVDSAPINAVADTLLVLPYVQSLLLVARADKTPEKAIARARDILAKAGKKPVGLVLNRLPARSGLASDPYHYYYNAGDGYGDAYGEKD